MARIKKKGLDYFPLNTDFIHDRAVRRPLGGSVREER